MRPDEVIAVSEPVASALRAHLSCEITVVPNFLADEVFTTTGEHVDGLPSAPYVMYAGDPGEHKGVTVLLEAWAKFKPAAALLLATTRPYPGDLPAGVTCLQLSREQVMTAWRGASVAVVPSKWPDPFPTAALEAMACGLPLVASRTGGLVDMVRDGEDGFLVPPAQVDALGGRLVELLANPAKARTMGEAAKERAAEFSARVVVGRIEAVYERARDHQRR